MTLFSRALTLPFCLLAFCLSLPATQAATFIDQTGRQVVIAAPPQRIVSLIPSITEIVFALGAGDRLQGVSQFSDEPPAAARLPRIGSYVRPDLEKIIALRPDLCLASRDGNPAHTVDRIRSLGIPAFVVDPRSLEEVAESIRLLGSVLGAEDEAALIVREMESKTAIAEQQAAAAGTKPRVFFQIDAAPIISAGSPTFIDTLISRAGGVNLAAGPVPYPRFSWEDALRLQPDVIIIASMAGGYSDEELTAAWRRWPQIPAVRDGRIHVVPADLFDRPTPRLADGLLRLTELLHRSAVPPTTRREP
ncbi:MAG: ABC transporter substrate-binding protein [Thermodesulfobacteriota bacterium]